MSMVAGSILRIHKVVEIKLVVVVVVVVVYSCFNIHAAGTP